MYQYKRAPDCLGLPMLVVITGLMLLLGATDSHGSSVESSSSTDVLLPTPVSTLISGTISLTTSTSPSTSPSTTTSLTTSTTTSTSPSKSTTTMNSVDSGTAVNSTDSSTTGNTNSRNTTISSTTDNNRTSISHTNINNAISSTENSTNRSSNNGTARRTEGIMSTKNDGTDNTGSSTTAPFIPTIPPEDQRLSITPSTPITVVTPGAVAATGLPHAEMNSSEAGAAFDPQSKTPIKCKNNAGNSVSGSMRNPNAMRRPDFFQETNQTIPSNLLTLLLKHTNMDVKVNGTTNETQVSKNSQRDSTSEMLTVPGVWETLKVGTAVLGSETPQGSLTTAADGAAAGMSSGDQTDQGGEQEPTQCVAEEERTVAPYGSWASPVSSDLVAKINNKIIEPPRVDPVTGDVFWTEELADEGGHGAVFQYDVESSTISRWSPPSVDVRSRVHEYGGGSFIVYNSTLYYSDAAADNQVFRQRGRHGVPDQLTNSTHHRYADASYAPTSQRLYLVCEDHSKVVSGERQEPQNSIVVLDLITGSQRTLLQHGDFFASPRVTEDGEQIVWIQWNHPQMPWDTTEMYVGDLQGPNGDLSYRMFFQHGSMMMPSWNQHRELLYVHDMTAWWNLYIVNRSGKEVSLTPGPVEVGWPTWTLGTQAYAHNPTVGAHEVVVIVGKELRVVDTVSGSWRVLQTGYDSYSLGVAFSPRSRKVYTVAGDSTRSPTIVEVDVESGAARPLLDSSSPVPEAYISTASLVQFPSTEGVFAYGHLYMPKNPLFTAPLGTLPPLLVRSHQGPTDAARTSLDLNFQFFTSRGFAILDVDYRGSTGYGRFYRELLKLKWGVYDVDDVVSGSQYLVQEGLVDPSLLFIDGASAGGFTTLAATTRQHSFMAGACFYGISDLQRLVESTHKFEAHYPTSLVGSPSQNRQRFADRSVINHPDNITTPLIFFHGTDDKVVPIDQAEKMYEVVKENGIPTAFVKYEGERHGFTREHSLKHSLEAELYFFSRIGNFSLSAVTSDIVIDNLDTWLADQSKQPMSV